MKQIDNIIPNERFAAVNKLPPSSLYLPEGGNIVTPGEEQYPSDDTSEQPNSTTSTSTSTPIGPLQRSRTEVNGSLTSQMSLVPIVIVVKHCYKALTLTGIHVGRRMIT